MKRKSISRLNRNQLGQLFATITDRRDSAQGDVSDHPMGQAAVPTCDGGSALEQPGTWIGRYKLLNVLGEGGMGVVYLAEQASPIRRKVALKVIKPGMDSKQVVARFSAEQQALAVMDHPHVAHVFDAGLTRTGRPYFVMEQVEGIPITEHCDQHKLTVEQRLELFMQVCAAVQHAHYKGIIHRDLKPSNILVSIKDSETLPKIIDFGVAKALAQPLTTRTLYTEKGQFIGTPEYMSPEQAEATAQGIDTRTDVYSLGVILYELLAGVLPFEADTLREGGPEHIRRVIREQDPKTPSTRLSTVAGEKSSKVAALRCTDSHSLGRSLHGDLDWITLKAMDKDPNRRYATALALAEDIQRHLRHEPVTAGAPGVVYRLRKFTRRHRIAVTGGTGALCLCLLGLLCVHLYRQNQIHENQLAQEQHTLAVQQAQADLLAAESSYTRGQYQQALTEVDRSLENLPDPLHGFLIKAQTLHALDRTNEALVLLRQLESEHPDEGSVYELLATVYVDKGQEALARKYHALAQNFPAETANALVILAMTSETMESMLARLSEALTLDRNHYYARRLRSLAYLSLAEFEHMERDADKLVFMQPDNPTGHALRAVALRHLERYADALAEHDRTLELAADSHPDLGEFLHQRGQTLFAMGRYERAAVDARACLCRQPQNINYRLALYSDLIALGQYDQAEQQFKTSLDTSARFSVWLTHYLADRRRAGTPLHMPTAHETGATARLMRMFQRRQTDCQAKARYLVPYGTAADFSPDGRYLVYSKFDPDIMWGKQPTLARPSKPGTQGIDIIDLEEGAVRPLVRFGHYPRWSPNGQYIAFVKTPFSYRQQASQQVYIVHADGGEPRRLCDEILLSWSSDSRYIYTYRWADHVVYRRAFDQPDLAPEPIIISPSYFPVISPDETRIAYEHRGVLVIKALDTADTIARWRLPYVPGYEEARWRLKGPGVTHFEPVPLAWSPSGREISLGSEIQETGLWIYELATHTASRVLEGNVLSGRWSRDGTKMALVLGPPDWTIWQAHVDPNQPTLVSLGSSVNKTQVCQEYVDGTEVSLMMVPEELSPMSRYYQGRYLAFAHAGLGQADGVVTGLEQWLQSLPQEVRDHPPTYWDAASHLLEWYGEHVKDPNNLVALARGMAQLAAKPWVGQVLTGMAFFRVGDYGKAMTILKQADVLRIQDEDSLHPDQVALTAMTLHGQGRKQEATDALNALRRMFPDACEYDLFQPLVKAEKALLKGQEPISILWDRVSEDNLDQALDLLNQIRRSEVVQDPSLAESLASAARQLALRFMAQAHGYAARCEYAQAMRLYESAVQSTPVNVSVLHRLTRYQLACPDVTLRDFDRAIENATRVCDLDRWAHSDFLETLANAYAAAGRFKEAALCQERVIKALAADTAQGTLQRQTLKLTLYRSGQAYHGQIVSGHQLVAHYEFEKNQAGLALDSSGNDLHGRFVGDACIVDDLQRGKVLSLDGEGDWIDCGDHPAFDLTEENTVSLWVKFKEYRGFYQGLIGKGNSTWRMARDNWAMGALHFTAGPGQHKVVGHVGIADDQWHHLVGVYDGSTLALYVDGWLDSSAPALGCMTPNESPVLIGAVLAGASPKSLTNDAQLWSHRTASAGLIDEVRIYNYALDGKAVASLFEEEN